MTRGYKVSCTDTDGEVRVIRTTDQDAADATAEYWRGRSWASDVKVEERP